jgi:OmpR family response regulator RpaB|tara:strand:+ start:4621 stop:5313 length:693 start_codon:yes stop_codon:yes gene_type:complete
VITYPKKILVVGLEKKVCRLLTILLNNHGYEIIVAHNSKDALVNFNKEKPDLLLIDLILPKITNSIFYRKVYETYQIPVIVIMTFETAPEQMLRLESKFNKYITKPFSLKELKNRIMLLLKYDNLKKEEIFQVYDLTINLTARLLKKKGVEVKLTDTEFTILELLITNAGNILSRTVILDNVWGYIPEREIDTRIVDVHISRLRLKLKEDPHKPTLILTARNNGYIFKGC